MKKNFMYALLGAIALTGAVSFSACSSSDEIVDNPDYNPETNTVKTAITMNVGHGSDKTRMTSEKTQNDNKFRGMHQVFIYPATALSGTAWAAITDGTSISAPVVSNENISSITTEASNKTYSDVQVTIGTNNFLFYGRGGTTSLTSTSSTADKLANGYTEPTFPTASSTTAGISFAAQTIANPASEDWTGPATILVNYLNSIKTAFTGTIANASFESIRLDFMKANTPRAGSADAVLATAKHLYETIGNTETGVYKSLSADDKTIADAVKTAITSAPASLSGTTISWATGEVTPKLTETTFPANLGLPLGAAQYQYNETSGNFEYVTTATPSVANTPVADFIYPSELFYFTNTPLKETNGNVTWPNTTATWQGADYTGWTDAVKATSKNIALVNNVQYGVAQLATRVKCTPSEGYLYDNSKEKDPTATTNKAIAYAANMFPLTGVLIGTQPASVGWNFLPSGTFSKCIYDKNVSYYNTTNSAEETIYANSGDYSGPNYTLVYDNDGFDDDNDATTPYPSVSVCLEFTNNSASDFYGKNGLIKVGQTFYLVGKLTLSASSSIAGFPTSAGNHDAVYYPSATLRAFIQDYTTTANFNITAGSATTKGSLANALSCIPDLKAVTQEIGLSVDLKWTQGLNFDVTLGQ